MLLPRLLDGCVLRRHGREGWRASVEVQQEISFTAKSSGIEINNLSILGGWFD